MAEIYHNGAPGCHAAAPFNVAQAARHAPPHGALTGLELRVAGFAWPLAVSADGAVRVPPAVDAALHPAIARAARAAALGALADAWGRLTPAGDAAVLATACDPPAVRAVRIHPTAAGAMHVALQAGPVAFNATVAPTGNVTLTEVPTTAAARTVAAAVARTAAMGFLREVFAAADLAGLAAPAMALPGQGRLPPGAVVPPPEGWNGGRA